MIRVNEDWVILVDQYSYTAVRDTHRTRKQYQEDGTEKIVPAYGRPIGYYTRLTDAVKAIAKAEYRRGLSGRETTLNEAIKLMEETIGRFEKILEGIKE